MIEVRIHGRGGQGNVIAAYLLGTAAFEQGLFCQAFPNFGAERRGAPVTAFVRISDRPILRRNQVSHPAFLIVQDSALLRLPEVTRGLRSGGGILVNSSRPPEALGQDWDAELMTVPATTMAKRILGMPYPNVPLVASFLALTELLPGESLATALGHRFHGDLLERNRQLIDEAMQQVPAGRWKERAHAAGN